MYPNKEGSHCYKRAVYKEGDFCWARNFFRETAVNTVCLQGGLLPKRKKIADAKEPCACTSGNPEEGEITFQGKRGERERRRDGGVAPVVHELGGPREDAMMEQGRDSTQWE